MFCFLQLKRHRSGFTLIELLIALGLFVVVGGALFFSFSQGFRLWHYGARSKPLAEVDFMLERLKGDLHNSFMDSGEPFVGTPESLQFFTECRAVSPEGKAPQEGVYFPSPVRVRYVFERSTSRLLREEENYKQLLSTSLKKEPVKMQTVLERTRGVSFEYYEGRDRQGARKWVRQWKQKCFPEAVKVTVQYDNLNQGLVTEEMINLPVKNCP